MTFFPPFTEEALSSEVYSIEINKSSLERYLFSKLQNDLRNNKDNINPEFKNIA